MKLEHSPALQLAFERARFFAVKDSAVAVAARHLLKGLLAEDEGNAVALLIGSGADWPRLQAHLGLPTPIEPAAPRDLPLHAALQIIMKQASELAIRQGEEGSVSTDHALLALLIVNESLRDELAAFGLDHERIRAASVCETAPLTMDEPLDFREPTEEVNVGRILDASANRAREAMRVLEDHARFVLGDSYLCAQLKQLRHGFAQVIQVLPNALLLDARDTLGDIGTTISTEAEWQRPSLVSVVQANAKRLQEALRSLEEYGKTLNSEFARRIERIRYQSYTLERALVQGGGARDRLANVQLCVLVTDSQCKASLVGTVKEAILGGAQMIQLREKDIDDRTLLARARDLRQITLASGAIFIVNDRLDIARLSDADGVHLGQDDLPIHEARRILGPEALIGVSTHNLEQVRRAVLEGASYLGVGPTFVSQTKSFSALAGLDFVQAAMPETSLPAFAIGGINLANVAQVVAAGARRIAVSNAICAADDARAAAQKLRSALSTR